MGKRYIFLYLLLVAITVFIIKAALFKNAEISSSASRVDSALTEKAEKMQSFSILGFADTGKKKWEVEGNSADILSEVINLSDITAKAYSNETDIDLKADRGVFDRRSNDLQLMDNVVAVTEEGTRLTTDRLVWNAKDERVTTDDKVFINRKDMDIEGVGASAKPDLRTAQLDKDVKINLKPSTIIMCSGPVEIDYIKNVSYFNNNVRLDDGRAQISADKATAYFDAKNRKIKKVICQGKVEVTRGENITYAEELTYIPDQGRVILTGRPKVVINSAQELMGGFDIKDAGAKDSKSN